MESETSFLDVYYLAANGFAPFDREDGSGARLALGPYQPHGEPQPLTLLVEMTDAGSRPIRSGPSFGVEDD